MKHADLWSKCTSGGMYYATTYSGLLHKQQEQICLIQECKM